MTDEDASPGESAESTMAQYVVVARARSAARFLPEEGWELNLDEVPGLQLGAVKVRAYPVGSCRRDLGPPRADH